MEPGRKIVADTSAVLAVCLHEETRQKIIAQTKGVELIAPPSLPLEVPNALSNKFKQSALDLDEAMAVIDRFEKIPIQQVPVDIREATELSYELNIYAYDAYMIAAAKRHSCPIITLDGGLSQAARQAGVEIIDIP
jgi:predicted nucleic acid-binding protein